MRSRPKICTVCLLCRKDVLMLFALSLRLVKILNLQCEAQMSLL